MQTLPEKSHSECARQKRDFVCRSGFHLQLGLENDPVAANQWMEENMFPFHRLAI
jgi:hypothetical protein